MAPTIADLVSDMLRSKLAMGLEAYLQVFKDLNAWHEMAPAFLFLPAGMMLEAVALELYQLPEMVNLRDLDDEMNKRRIDLDARGEFGRGPQALARNGGLKSARPQAAASFSGGQVRGRPC